MSSYVAELMISVYVVVAIALSWGVVRIFVKDARRRRKALYISAAIFVFLGLLFNWTRYQMQSGGIPLSPQERAYFEKLNREYEQRALAECTGLSKVDCHRKLIAPKSTAAPK